MLDFLGFQFRVILNPIGIPFYYLRVFKPEHDFLFKSSSTYCGSKRMEESQEQIILIVTHDTNDKIYDYSFYNKSFSNYSRY